MARCLLRSAKHAILIAYSLSLHRETSNPLTSAPRPRRTKPQKAKRTQQYMRIQQSHHVILQNNVVAETNVFKYHVSNTEREHEQFDREFLGHHRPISCHFSARPANMLELNFWFTYNKFLSRCSTSSTFQKTICNIHESPRNPCQPCSSGHFCIAHVGLVYSFAHFFSIRTTS